MSLTGGLGNQLFQLAFALSITNKKFGLEWKIAKPRLNVIGQPEICSFRLSDKSELVTNNRTGSKLVSKSQGFILRMGHSPRGIEKISVIRFVFNQIANLIGLSYFHEIRRIVYSTNIGFCDIKIPDKKILVIGYFQSYKWAIRPEVFQALSDMEPVNRSSELENNIELAISEKPLIIHIRLGDYLSEENFGIPSPEYYREALSKMLANSEYGCIWIFSDEIDKAKKYLTFDFPLDVRWISAINDSSSETLELMRYGYGYIIGNSSFSWWGAFLSRNSNVKVIAPSPWFRNLPEPEDLIPPTWSRIPAQF